MVIHKQKTYDHDREKKMENSGRASYYIQQKPKNVMYQYIQQSGGGGGGARGHRYHPGVIEPKGVHGDNKLEKK